MKLEIRTGIEVVPERGSDSTIHHYFFALLCVPFAPLRLSAVEWF